MGSGQTLNGTNRKTGRRNRGYWRNSEYHLSPMCPSRGAPYRDFAPVSPLSGSSYRPSRLSISMESSLRPREEGSFTQGAYKGICEPSYSATLDSVRQFAAMFACSGAFDTGNTANSVCLRWLGRRSSVLERWGVPRRHLSCVCKIQKWRYAA